MGDLWEDYQVAQVTRDFAINKIVISEELLTIKKRERKLDQADAAAVTAAENAVNDDTQTLIDEETALTDSALDLLESLGSLTLASLQDQSSTPAEGGVASTNYTDEEQKDLAAEAEKARLTLAKASSEDEGPPPEAAPVEEVVTPEASSESEMLQQIQDLLDASSGKSDEASSSGSDAAASTGGCASNTFIGQQQEDGSWKTMCKE